MKKVKFSEVFVGELFFDEVSGELFRKEDMETASVMSSAGTLRSPDCFLLDEYVMVEDE